MAGRCLLWNFPVVGSCTATHSPLHPSHHIPCGDASSMVSMMTPLQRSRASKAEGSTVPAQRSAEAAGAQAGTTSAGRGRSDGHC